MSDFVSDLIIKSLGGPGALGPRGALHLNGDTPFRQLARAADRHLADLFAPSPCSARVASSDWMFCDIEPPARGSRGA